MTDSLETNLKIERVIDEIQPPTHLIVSTSSNACPPPKISVTMKNQQKPTEDNVLESVQYLYHNQIHQLLDIVCEYAKDWSENLIPEDLIIKDKTEYNVIQSYRHAKTVNNENLGKKLVDQMISHENQIFDTRNQGKEVRPIVIEPPKIIMPTASVKAPKKKVRFFS